MALVAEPGEKSFHQAIIVRPLALFYKVGYSIATYLFIPMAKQIQLIQLKNKETGEVYWSRKNKKKVERKIELKKYSAKLRKHVTFKEAKK